MSGNWGPLPTRRSGGSRRRRIALSVLSVVVGLILISLFDRIGGIANSEITASVIVVGLLVVGVVYDLRPWSQS